MTEQEQNIDAKKRALAESVGDFIKYWGFKEIHGKIWVQIYLSNTPVTAKELTQTLGVTKGSVSTTLSDLIAYQVIEKVHTGDARSPAYQSNTDLFESINNVLRNRELKMTKRIRENIDALIPETNSCDPETTKKLEKMREMTNFAVVSLEKLLENKTIPTERFKLIMRLIS